MSSRDLFYLASRASRHGVENLNQAREMLEKRGFHTAEQHIAADRDELIKLARGAVRAGRKTIIASGGDGTETTVVGELAHKDVTLGVVPGGTGNSFALGLGIENSVEQAVDVIAGGRTAHVDLGVVNGTYFANFITIGLAAEISRDTPKLLKRVAGVAAYGIAALWPIATHPTFRAKVKWKGNKLDIKTHQLIIANGRFFGRQPLLPDASFTDGQLSFFTTTGGNAIDVLSLYIDLVRGDHLARRDAQFFNARKIKVKTKKKQPISVDGSYLGMTPAKVRVAARALRVFVPQTFQDGGL